tara:strand:- start:56 stop:1048 length:993 start_codon:yes stop_codon:yes gene_type:complete
MINWLKGLYHPEAFHGSKSGSPYFEGWYHKIVSKDRRAIVIIPGMYRSGVIENEFSFIMVFDGSTGHVHFERFPISEFSSKIEIYDTRIGRNHFFKNGIDLNISSSNFSLKGSVNFKNQNPWPVTLVEPGCMGWYNYLPVMECYHGILSMHHTLSGTLALNSHQIDFNDGVGYTEKDWGKSFPKSWIWVQANHFRKNKISLSASIARIPLLGTQFAGFIIGLLIEEKFYRFTTYRSSKIDHLSFSNNKIEWVVKQKELTLKIFISLGEKTGLLFAPDSKDMIEKVEEHLDSKVRFKLENNGKIIFEDESSFAASEVVGDIRALFKLANNN